nr:AbiH family protein [uncultured Porphyromonas sp.]
MNDIIILGNGFDLAHGLATGYKDYVRAMLIDSLIVKGGARSTYKDSPFKLSGSINNSGLDQVNLSSLTKKRIASYVNFTTGC